MDDLIRRQAAIKAIEDLPNCYNGFSDTYDKSCIIGVLEELPSAQPEPKWIPCSERLPEDGTWNIFSDGKNISVERYKMDAIDHFFPQGRWFSLDEAIAWMPLPEPYREEVSD